MCVYHFSRGRHDCKLQNLCFRDLRRKKKLFPYTDVFEKAAGATATVHNTNPKSPVPFGNFTKLTRHFLPKYKTDYELLRDGSM